ncbi:MAG: hypothetical protein LBI58_03490 [Tannerellaceae bacterium]|jgi:hypothetical protein|nr:hypothetical protein [Tannerellaceae bacterium]
MKKVTFAILLACALVLPGCGVTSTAMINDNTTLTNVELSKKNFVVLGQTEGVSSDMYILGFGGFAKRLYGKAKTDMLQKANLKGKSRAVVNITYDTHIAFYFFVNVYTVTATGTVIEFTE